MMTTWRILLLLLALFTIEASSCQGQPQENALELLCDSGTTVDQFGYGSLSSLQLESIEKLVILNKDGVRGSLTSIPMNICQFKNLKHLDISQNSLKEIGFDFPPSCLSNLETLDLQDNRLKEIAVPWFRQLSRLKIINLSRNRLTCLSYDLFHNLSSIEKLDVSYNRLNVLEFWLFQVKDLLDYSYNPVERFSNKFNVDLSDERWNPTRDIRFNHDDQLQIPFDDSLFIMYNRCGEMSGARPLLKQLIIDLHQQWSPVLHWNCSCTQFHFQEYLIQSEELGWSDFRCNNRSSSYVEQCQNRSAVDVSNVKPRLCKIYSTETGTIPVLDDGTDCSPNMNQSSLDEISKDIYHELDDLEINEAGRFAIIIDEGYSRLKNLSQHDESIVDPFVERFQNITFLIESFLESINVSLNITKNSVAIRSQTTASSIYTLTQINGTNGTLGYFSNSSDQNGLLVSITIESADLSPDDIYTLYILPSLFFEYAQNDPNIIIVSSIVGVHFPRPSRRVIRMVFADEKRSFGRYSCVFWQENRWNDSGCTYSPLSQSNRHSCVCNHSTSFALIFIPEKILGETFLASIIIGSISIVCLCLSMILSIYRQMKSPRHLSWINIFTLLNSLILFIFLTIFLVRSHRFALDRSTKHEQCQKSLRNFAITTYFFLLLTFASKTLLGISYCLTTFSRFLAHREHCLLNGFVLIIIFALIPTIVLTVLNSQGKNLLVQYGDICWLKSSILFPFVSIPILIPLTVNLVILVGITVRLILFCFKPPTAQLREKRLVLALMIWVASCIALGIAWIFGPFLDLLIKEKTPSTSSAAGQWIFTIFIGLEGLWVLIVNVIFYLHQNNRPTKFG